MRAASGEQPAVAAEEAGSDVRGQAAAGGQPWKKVYVEPSRRVKEILEEELSFRKEACHVKHPAAVALEGIWSVKKDFSIGSLKPVSQNRNGLLLQPQFYSRHAGMKIWTFQFPMYCHRAQVHKKRKPEDMEAPTVIRDCKSTGAVSGLPGHREGIQEGVRRPQTKNHHWTKRGMKSRVSNDSARRDTERIKHDYIAVGQVKDIDAQLVSPQSYW